MTSEILRCEEYIHAVTQILYDSRSSGNEKLSLFTVRQVGRLLQFKSFLKFPVCEYNAPLHSFSSGAAAQNWPGPPH